MKRFIKNLLILIFAVTAAVCSVAGLTACADENLLSISVTDARLDFKVGDEFEYGEYFKVYANYKDGTSEDVTDQAQVRKENGFDMNVAGDYQITVSFGGKKEVYTIYVSSFDDVLKKLEVEGGKTEFKLGESFVYDGLKLTATYENAQGNLINREYGSLREFTVEITDENGQKVDEVFPKFGSYTVTISKSGVKTSYGVTVADVDISTVQGALAVGAAFQSEVISGTLKFNEGLAGMSPILAADYEYKFGNNYTYYIEKRDNPKNEFHMSMDEEGFFYVQLQGGSMVSNNNAQSLMMNGVPVQLWYYNTTEYGIESVLNNLYKYSKSATNNDLVETADAAERKYSFSFSGLVLRSNMYDYYETEVSFTLGENYNIESVEFTQSEWENNDKMEGVEGYKPMFITDPETGITRSNDRYTQKINVKCNQVAGTRTEENPYSREMFKITSYDLKYKGETLEDDAVIDCDVASPKILIDITAVTPETANFSLDMIYLNYEGSYVQDTATGVECEGFYAYTIGDQLIVTLRNGGVWKLILKTELTEKTITFNVKGVAPSAMTAQVRNEATKTFYAASSKIMALNGETYFYGAVGKYEDSEQTAEIISSNASSGKIEKVDGEKFFKFTATQTGEYQIKITSVAAPSVSSTLTVTVSDLPDYGRLLSGKYTVTDMQENVYDIEFTPSGSGETVSGSVKITKTPTDEQNGALITAQAKTETLSYTVDYENFAINLTHSSGENLGIALGVNASGALTLEDQYEDVYPLTAVAD